MRVCCLLLFIIAFVCASITRARARTCTPDTIYEITPEIGLARLAGLAVCKKPILTVCCVVIFRASNHAHSQHSCIIFQLL